MWAGIGAFLQILLLVAKWWFGLDDQKKEKAKELLKEVPDATKTRSSVTRMFTSIDLL